MCVEFLTYLRKMMYEVLSRSRYFYNTKNTKSFTIISRRYNKVNKQRLCNPNVKLKKITVPFESKKIVCKVVFIFYI